MKNLTTLFATGLVAFSITLFAQNNAATFHSPQANSENPALIFGTHISLNTPPASAQLTKPGNSHQPKSAVHKPTVHKPQDGGPNSVPYDSIHYWNWDTTILNWQAQPYGRTTLVTHNAANLITGNVYQVWVDSTSAWANGQQTFYTYDANNNLTSWTYKNWNDSVWVNQDSGVFTFNVNNKETGEINYSWDTSSWTPGEEYSYTYDANNNETSWTYKNWGGSALVNQDSDVYTYDGSNNNTVETDYTWNTSSWAPDKEYLYTYNGSNDKLTDAYKTWDGSAWANSDSIAYVYDINNNNTVEVDYQWNTSVWENEDSDAYTYNGGNKETSEIDFIWNSTQWDTSGEYLSTYDVNNNQLSWANKTWNSGSGWANEDSDSYHYDVNNNEISGAYYTGNNTVWMKSETWNNSYDANNIEQGYGNKSYDSTGKVYWGDSVFYYYTNTTGINNLASQNDNLLVYPNPSNGQFTILVKSEVLRGKSIVEVYNVLGEQVLTETPVRTGTGGLRSTQGDNVIDMGSQPDGVYLYRVITQEGNLVGQGKLIIQK